MKINATIVLALASAATSLASAATAVAESLTGQPGAAAPTPEAAEEEAPKRRGRPAKAAAEDDDTPPPAAKGKTLDELKQIIAPAIKGNKGNEVSAIIEKHAGAGKKLKDLAEMPEKHKAFEKDIAAISLDANEDDY